MGILPLLFSYPQALVWGADPIALVSGGTVIWMLVVISTFWLAWRVYGPSVAGWAIVPLVFSSLGTIWLSGRITGGHLLTLAWHTLAVRGAACLPHARGWRSAAILGVWCGLGLYLDAMFLFTLAGIVLAALLAWLSGWRSTVGDRAGRGLPGRAGRRASCPGRSAGGSTRTTPIRRSSRRRFEASALAQHASLLASSACRAWWPAAGCTTVRRIDGRPAFTPLAPRRANGRAIAAC